MKIIQKIRNKITRQKYWDIVNQARNKPCIDCGIQLPEECMEFDYIRGGKLFEVTCFVKYGAGKQKILDEIAKCDIRCPNCHKLRHHQENYKTGVYKLESIKEIEPQWQKTLGFK